MAASHLAKRPAMKAASERLMATVIEETEEDDYVAFVRPQGRPVVIRPTASSTELDELSVTLTVTTIESDDTVFAGNSSSTLLEAVKRSLVKPAENRSPAEVGTIFNFVCHLPCLANFSDDTKRAICAKSVLAVVPYADTVIYSLGNRMDSWGIVLKGDVESSNAQGHRTVLSRGDAFGVRPVSGEQPSTSTLRTFSDDSHLLLVSQDDYVGAVNGPTVRTFYDEVSGEETCEVQLQSTGGFLITKGSLEKLIEWLLEGHWVEWDEHFAEDFFLTYRVICAAKTLFQQLLTHFEGKPSRVAQVVIQWINFAFEDFDGTMLKMFERLLESASMSTELLLLDLALSAHSKTRSIILKRAEASDPLGFEYISNGWFITKSERFGLERGDQILSLNGHRLQQVVVSLGETLLHGSCVLDLEVKQNPLDFKEALKNATKPKKFLRKFIRKSSSRNTRSGRSTLPRSKPTTSLLSCTAPPFPKERLSGIAVKEQRLATEPKKVIKVFRGDQSHRFLAIFSHTSAQNVVQLALQEFELTGEKSSDWSLLEVTVTPEGVVKQHRIPDHVCSLPSRVRSTNRFYLKPNASDVRLSDDVLDDIASNVLSVLQCDALGTAKCLLQRHQNLFAKIDRVEFVRHLFKKGAESDWANLSVFERQFNWEVNWVITTVCSEKNVQQRARVIKKFIKIAGHSRSLQNLNSMFAIVSGLVNRCVARLHSAWERVPQKYLNLLAELKRLCNPSRNMLEYRKHLMVASQNPPVIPVLPFLSKDLFFANDGNATWSAKKLINFSKFRMIAEIIRNSLEMARVPEPPEEPQSSIKDWKNIYEEEEKAVQINEYLDRAEVVESEVEQERLSFDCEPRRKPVRTPSTLSSKSSHSVSSGRTSTSSPWTSRRLPNPIPVEAPPTPYNERLI
ncbi:hypothetical protein QR680_009663 [Steinernema hermaphroditum]|uniref:Ras-GEF domain-containing protein n=1 Tax=Steinernema hermaphroditum TaxID=289476 RepID=A0AA39IL67_9BILA|nr:hypothetical protein QR680_009663 [Steinernema hermaphroditum]